MSLQQQLSDEGDVPPPSVRLDAETQKKVIALAAQLQTRHQETVSVAELEDAAAEVGLHAIFVRQALAQIGSAPVTAAPPPQRAQRLTHWLPEQGQGATTRCALLTIGLSALCGLGLLEFHYIPFAYGGFVLSALAGFRLGNARKAFWVGTAGMATEIAVNVLSSHGAISDTPVDCFIPVLAGGLGSLTALIRVGGFHFRQNASRQKDTTPTTPL